MKVLSKEKTIEYIKHAIDLESSIVAQEQIIENYKSISDEKKPVLDLQPLPKRKYVEEDNDSSSWFTAIFLAVSGLVIAASCLFLGSGFIAFMGVVGLGLAVLGIVFISGLAAEKREKRSLQEEYDAHYKTESERIKAENERHRERIIRTSPSGKLGSILNSV